MAAAGIIRWLGTPTFCMDDMVHDMVWSWCMHIRLHVLECHTIASANSSYYEGLDLEDKKRYDVKIATLGNLGDPYAARKKLSTSLEWQNP